MFTAGLLVLGFSLGYAIGLFDSDKREPNAQQPPIVQTVVQTVVHTVLPPSLSIPPTNQPTITPRPTIDYSVLPTVGVACGNHRTCGGMTNCEHVFACYYDGRGRLDGDGDGIPCEDICPGVLYAPRGYPTPRGYPSPTLP